MQDTNDSTRTSASPPNPVALDLSFTEFIVLIAAMMALTALSIDIMLPALPAIGRALDIGEANELQKIIVIYMAGFSVGQLTYGPLSDHVGRKPVLMLGLAVFVAGTLGALVSSSFDGLLAARFVQGLGAASPRVIAIAVVRDLYAGRQMARVMSLAMMVFIIIPVLAPTIGQALMHLGDWHIMFEALLALALAVAVWTGLRLPETSRHARGEEPVSSLRQALVEVVTDHQTMGYAAAGGLMFGCLLSYVASSQQIYVDVFGVGDLFPVVFGAVASLLSAASLVNARLVERHGMRRLSHAALKGFIAASLALTGLSAASLASFVPFVILAGIAFFCFGLIAPNFNALAMERQGHNAGMASSVVGSLSTATGALAAGYVGSAFDGTTLPLALGFAVLSLAASALVVWVERTAPKRD